LKQLFADVALTDDHDWSDRKVLKDKTTYALSKPRVLHEQKRILKASDEERLVWVNRKLHDGYEPIVRENTIVGSAKGEVTIVGRKAGSGEPGGDSSIVGGNVVCGVGGPAGDGNITGGNGGRCGGGAQPFRRVARCGGRRGSGAQPLRRNPRCGGRRGDRPG